MTRARVCEWPTLVLVLAVTTVWGLSLWGLTQVSLVAGLALAAAMGTWHSSCQHEVLHGHPTRIGWLNEALVYFPIGLFVPYRRFKVLHLRHHNNDRLTDPYDDPESYYMMWRDWDRLPKGLQLILAVNNTLAGRLIIGPLVSMVGFLGAEARLIAKDTRGVRNAWLHHLAGLVPVLWFITVICGLPLWLYLVGVAYPAMALLMVRTYAEHRAHETPEGRTIIVERSPVLALLFLNNNLHLVHHRYPRVAWYHLPALYREQRSFWAELNDGYVFSSYLALAQRYLFKRKEPVPHPLIGLPGQEYPSLAGEGGPVAVSVPPVMAGAPVPAEKS